jgi:phosphoglycolate phosphatase/putative hydrolase of the HAD superfamily
MKIYRLPRGIDAVLFDIDGTLYTNKDYVDFQIDVLIDELARIRGEPREATAAAIENVRSRLAAADGGKRTSLGNAMAALGVDIATSVEWRSRLIDPSRFLSADPRLRAALESLRPLRLVAVTNNPRPVGEATLEALGIEDLFIRVVGLDDTMKSKPASEPYLLAAQAAGADPGACVSVGDRYDVDLAIPLAMGMGAILVTGVEDVYALHDILKPTSGSQPT